MKKVNKHEHTECAHEKLHFCKQCSVVWCETCPKEFRISPAPYWTIYSGTSTVTAKPLTGVTYTQYQDSSGHLTHNVA
jgi:hypothetical protein